MHPKLTIEQSVKHWQYLLNSVDYFIQNNVEQKIDFPKTQSGKNNSRQYSA